MPHPEALAHSLSEQLIENCHAIEQAVSNHRWTELSRLYIINAEIGVKLVEALVQLDEQAAEHVVKEIAVLHRFKQVVTAIEQNKAPAASLPEGAQVASIAGGSVGVVKRGFPAKKPEQKES